MAEAGVSSTAHDDKTAVETTPDSTDNKVKFMAKRFSLYNFHEYNGLDLRRMLKWKRCQLS